MKHARHYQVLEHEGVRGIQRGDVSSWARGRSMPSIDTAKKLDTASAPRLRAPDRDSLAAAQMRKRRIQARLDAEHAAEVERGLREARALERARASRARGAVILESQGKFVAKSRPAEPDVSAVAERTHEIADFFNRLYASRVVKKANP